MQVTGKGSNQTVRMCRLVWAFAGRTYPGTTSFGPPKKYFVLFYLLSSPIVLVIALYYLSVQEQQI